jgi:hypothetical protein
MRHSRHDHDKQSAERFPAAPHLARANQPPSALEEPRQPAPPQTLSHAPPPPSPPPQHKPSRCGRWRLPCSAGCVALDAIAACDAECAAGSRISASLALLTGPPPAGRGWRSPPSPPGGTPMSPLCPCRPAVAVAGRRAPGLFAELPGCGGPDLHGGAKQQGGRPRQQRHGLQPTISPRFLVCSVTRMGSSGSAERAHLHQRRDPGRLPGAPES